jgi:hypothetical protein
VGWLATECQHDLGFVQWEPATKSAATRVCGSVVANASRP